MAIRNWTNGGGLAISAANLNSLEADLEGKVTAPADPGADRILFWDDSANAWAHLTASTGLTISGTTLTVAAASETVSGRVELATAAETATGTDATRAVSPANLLPLLDAKADKAATGMPSASDLNTFTTTGNWNAQSSSAYTGGANWPKNTSGMLSVIARADGTTITQRFKEHTGAQAIYERSFYGTVWYPWVPLAVDTAATSSAAGTMSAADKAKLDAATAATSNGTMVMRDSSGNSAFDAVVLSDNPTAVSHATRKDYVDAQVATAYSKTAVVIPSSMDLDTYTTPGLYHQPSSANAGNGTNYPFGLAGLLEVFSSGSMVYQRYTVYSTGTTYVRVKYNTAWCAWMELSAVGHTHSAATASVAGFMSAADKAKLDAATATEVASTVVMRDGSGNTFFGSVVLNDAAPAGASYAVRKDYVDAQVAAAANSNLSGSATNPVTVVGAARPTGMTSVWWATPTQPTNWANGDFWVVTP